MATDVVMPQMGESIFEGTITKWLKKPGDKVERDEPLFEISTDKVDAEIPSPSAGVLKEIKVNEGQTVPIQTVVAVIDGAGSAAAAPAPAPAKAATPTPAPAPAAAAPAPPPATRPAAPAPAVQRQSHASRSSGSTCTPAHRGADSQLAARAAHGRGTWHRSDDRPRNRRRRADQQARHRSGHRGWAEFPPLLPPSAPAAVPSRPTMPPPSAPAAAPAPLAGSGGQVHVAFESAVPREKLYFGNYTVEPMSNMRQRIAEHMVASKRVSPHVYSVDEIDMTKVAALRAKSKDEFEKRYETKLTFMPFFVKAAVAGLRAFPTMNASLDGTNVVLHKEINIGIAVALDWGLIVPVVKGADEKNVLGIQRTLNDLAERARSKKLKPEEVQEGTFSITNPGVFGGLVWPAGDQPAQRGHPGARHD